MSTMATTRKGFKRIMGEIPEEMHEKITQYNKISDRPLNVSKAIELCMAQAIKKIDAELIAEAANNDTNGIYASDECFNAIHDDIEAGLLGPKAILKHYIEILKKEGWDMINDDGKIPLYPIDRVEYTDEPPQIHFNAKGVTCFGICPSYSDTDYDLLDIDVNPEDSIETTPSDKD
jgi:hypothetical protein